MLVRTAKRRVKSDENARRILWAYSKSCDLWEVGLDWNQIPSGSDSGAEAGSAFLPAPGGDDERFQHDLFGHVGV